MKSLQLSVILASLLLVSESTQNATSGTTVGATQLSDCFSRRPLRNLVYRFEGIVDQNPAFRTGCEVQYRSYGSTGFDLNLKSQREELEAQHVGFFDPPSTVLKYFVVNARGEEQIVPRDGSVALEIPGESLHRNLTREQFCFPRKCYDPATFFYSCMLPWRKEDPILDPFIYHPIDRTLYRLGQVDRYSVSLYCQPKHKPQRLPLLTASASFPVSEIMKLHSHDNLTFDLGPHLTYMYWMSYDVGDTFFESIGCLLRTPIETPGQIYRTFVWGREYLKDPREFVPTNEAYYGLNVTHTSKSGQKSNISLCFPSRCFPNEAEVRQCKETDKSEYSPRGHDFHVKYHEDGYSPGLYYQTGSIRTCETRTLSTARNNNKTTPVEFEQYFMCNSGLIKT